MIREFLETDFESIYDLGNEITNSFSQTNDLIQIRKDPYTKILVYLLKDKIVGFIMYTILEETIDILNIIVSKENRHQRIASCLIDYMISDMPSTIKSITLEVRKSNLPAINLYSKFGFEVINVRKKYYSNGEDAYLMGRVIK